MKRVLILLLAAALVVSLLAACSQAKPSALSATVSASSVAPASTSAAATTAPTVQTISPADAKKLLDTGTGVVLVDVRTAEEYAAGHIAGSILIPLESIAADAAAKLPDKAATIVVYCRTGIRGAEAAKQLMGIGYTQVFNMTGGITAWTFGTVK